MTTDPRFLPPTPFARLLKTHAASVCADACVTVSLAGSLFFSSPAESSRGKMLLYLVLTLLPFAVIAPLLGPALDRTRGGRRILIVVTMAGRAVMCFLMARVILEDAPTGLLVYPFAFAISVFGKSYAISKSSLVPAVVTDDRELVRANSRLNVVTSIAMLVGGAPAALLQWIFDARASLFLAMVVFIAAAVLAAKIPRVQTAQDPAEVELENLELHQPSILLAGSAMGVLRAAGGFLVFFAAFSLKHDTLALGFVFAMAAIGAFAANLTAPRLREMFSEENMLASALVVSASFMLLAFLASGVPGFAFATMGIAVAGAFGRLGFDSLLQRDGPDAIRGRAFARFETRFQVATVLGCLVGIIPLRESIGLLACALLLFGAAISYVAGLRATRSRTTLRPRALDEAVGRAKSHARARWRRSAVRRSVGRRSPPSGGGPARRSPSRGLPRRPPRNGPPELE